MKGGKYKGYDYLEIYYNDWSHVDDKIGWGLCGGFILIQLSFVC